MNNISDEEQRIIFSENLLRYVRQSGKQQKDIAIDLGFNSKTFNGWCNGLSMPTMGKVQAIADYFNIGKSDLLDKKVDIQGKTATARKIPVLGRVAAGIPIEMIEEVIDWEEIPGDMAGDYFGLKIKGDSMEPKISDGDTVIVRQQPEVENGEIAIVTINGQDATCKRIFKYAETLVLRSDNPKHDEKTFAKEEVANLPVRILGKVVELRAKF